MKLPRALLCVLHLLAIPSVASELERGWPAAGFKFEQARSEFASSLVHSTSGDSTERALAEGGALLSAQPRTNANIERSEALLRSVVDRATALEQTIVARYLLARIEHMHKAGGSVRVAAELYRSLFEAHPAHRLAQQAAVKYALILLYQTPGGDPRDAMRALAPLAERLTDLAARRDFHLALGEAALFFHLEPEWALPQFLAAYETGAEDPSRRADTLVTIAELARRAGRQALATQFYRRFLVEVPSSDRRHGAVIDRLAEMQPGRDARLARP